MKPQASQETYDVQVDNAQIMHRMLVHHSYRKNLWFFLPFFACNLYIIILSWIYDDLKKTKKKDIEVS